MSIYQKYALDYLKAGYSVIPDKKGSKKPAIENWTEYSTRLPSFEEVSSWNHIQDANISLVLGEKSGIISLDLDSENPELLSKIEHLLPQSPVERIGKKGWARFFKYSGEDTQTLYETYEDNGQIKKRVILELLSHNKKITIPPSLHPSGNNYIWSKTPLLEFNKSDLPSFPPMLFSVLKEKLQVEYRSIENLTKISSGRNMTLTTFCSELIRDQIDIESATQKLIKFDQENNAVPLFSDPSENKTIFPMINATKFFINHLESFNIKRAKEGLLPELPLGLLNPTETVDLNQNLSPENPELSASNLVSLPSPTGLIKEISDYILKCSYVEQPIFAMNAAIILLGTVISRKMIFRNTTPNLYILNVANSGSGKDSCLQALKRLLKASKAYDLIGASSYPSEASIMCNLETSPARIDIIDEASSFLKSASKGGAAYQTGIGDILCELYTSANEDYLGKILASQGGKRVGRCSRPHVNILCTTTFKGVSEGISQSTLEKGLFARFLTFFGEDFKPAKQIKQSIPIPLSVINNLQYWNAFSNPLETGNMDVNKLAYNIGITDEADSLLDTYFMELDKLRWGRKSSDIMRPIVSRLFQQMLKIILITTVSNTEKSKLPKVQVTDVEFGHQLIMYFYQNIQEFVENALHDDDRSSKVNKMLHYIKSHGTTGVSNIDIVKYCKGINPKERLEILKDLRESQLIAMKRVLINTVESYIFTFIGGE